jgi:hypothetical protein
MELLVELLGLIDEAEKKAKVTKTLRQKVYHADYLKTKDKPYRQYERPKRKKRSDKE